MRKNSFLEFLIKNKYVIIGITIVLVLAFCGVIGIIMEICFTIFLILLAIYIGKRIQDDESYISKTLSERKEKISKPDENKEEE